MVPRQVSRRGGMMRHRGGVLAAPCTGPGSAARFEDALLAAPRCVAKGRHRSALNEMANFADTRLHPIGQRPAPARLIPAPPPGAPTPPAPAPGRAAAAPAPAAPGVPTPPAPAPGRAAAVQPLGTPTRLQTTASAAPVAATAMMPVAASIKIVRFINTSLILQHFRTVRCA